MTTVLTDLALVTVGLLAGLRLNQRRFLTERAKRVALDTRFDAYRLADTRGDLDFAGPVTTEHPLVEPSDGEAIEPHYDWAQEPQGPWLPAAPVRWEP